MRGTYCDLSHTMTGRLVAIWKNLRESSLPQIYPPTMSLFSRKVSTKKFQVNSVPWVTLSQIKNCNWKFPLKRFITLFGVLVIHTSTDMSTREFPVDHCWERGVSLSTGKGMKGVSTEEHEKRPHSVVQSSRKVSVVLGKPSLVDWNEKWKLKLKL